MSTTSTSTSAVVAIAEPVFTSQERLALAGFLAGYTGLTREAYALDLRQYATWCHQRHIPLPQGRQGSHHPARAAHRPSNRPGHRRTVRRPHLSHP